MAGGRPPLIHNRRRLRQGPLRRLGIQIWSACHHHIRQRGPVHVRLVGGPMQFAQHSPFTYDSLPPSIQRARSPQAAEGRPAVSVRRRQGSIRLAADSAGSVRQHRRVAVAILPQGPSDCHDRPLTAADAAQLGAGPIVTTGGVAAGPLRAGPPGRREAAAVPSLRRTLPSTGAVNTFLPPRDRREDRQGIDTLPQSSQDTHGHRTSQAAAQGLPHCAGAACPRTAAVTAAFSFPPTSTTTSASGRCSMLKKK